MIKKPLVSIIIPNYNGEKYLHTCLSSVLKSDFKSYEVLLCDDGSTDRSIQIIEEYIKKSKKIILLKNNSNLGAAQSRNKVIAIAKGKYIIFLDNDTKVTTNWIKELIKPMEKDMQIGASQALLFDMKNPKNVQMAGGLLIPQVPWLVPFFAQQEYKLVKHQIVGRSILAISAALAVRSEVIKKIEGFDAKEAVYTEDLDFCWRIWIAGYKIVLAPNSVVYHWTKSVSDRKGMSASYTQIYFNLAKNSIRSILKNYELINIIRYLPFTLGINLLRGVFYLVLSRRSDALVGSIQGLVWNLYNFSDTLKQRDKIQKLRKYSDEYLYKEIMSKESLWSIYKKYFR